MDLTCVEILPPEVQGSWLAVPISPPVALTTPKLCVVQNNLVNELPSSSAWLVRNLTVGIAPDAAGSRFYDDIHAAEEFVKLGTAALWPFWHGSMFDRQFVTTLRNTTNGQFQAEMRINVLFNKQSELQVVDHAGRSLSPRDIAVGTIVVIDMVLSGMWCSADRCGMRYTVKTITVLDEREAIAAPCVLD